MSKKNINTKTQRHGVIKKNEVFSLCLAFKNKRHGKNAKSVLLAKKLCLCVSVFFKFFL